LASSSLTSPSRHFSWRTVSQPAARHSALRPLRGGDESRMLPRRPVRTHYRNGSGRWAAVYDRASLVSWAPEQRGRYVEHLAALTGTGPAHVAGHSRIPGGGDERASIFRGFCRSATSLLAPLFDSRVGSTRGLGQRTSDARPWPFRPHRGVLPNYAFVIPLPTPISQGSNQHGPNSRNPGRYLAPAIGACAVVSAPRAARTDHRSTIRCLPHLPGRAS